MIALTDMVVEHHKTHGYGSLIQPAMQTLALNVTTLHSLWACLVVYGHEFHWQGILVYAASCIFGDCQLHRQNNTTGVDFMDLEHIVTEWPH